MRSTILPTLPYRILDAYAVFSYLTEGNTQLICVCEDDTAANDLAARPGPTGVPGFVLAVKVLTYDGHTGNILAIGEAVPILLRAGVPSPP